MIFDPARPGKARTDARYDLGFIRVVLARYDETGNAMGTAKEFDIPYSNTVSKWARRRDSLGDDWPNAHDVAVHREDNLNRAAQRDRSREWTREYVKRRYFAGGPTQVPSLGTTRRLRALAAIGWTQKDVAAELGLSPQRINHLTRGRYPLLYPSTVAAVTAVYDRLGMVVPIDPPVVKERGQRPHEACRRRARRLGWKPPLAWDDDTIDNPRARGQLGRTTARPRHEVDPIVVERVLDGDNTLDTTTAEKFEIMRRWLADGRTERSLCERMGWRESRYSPRPDDAEEAS